MQAYRAYILDDDGIVLRVKVFESHSDDEAAHAAAGWAGNQPHELWRGSRRIMPAAAPASAARATSRR
jgi:hypothetical protein